MFASKYRNWCALLLEESRWPIFCFSPPQQEGAADIWLWGTTHVCLASIDSNPWGVLCMWAYCYSPLVLKWVRNYVDISHENQYWSLCGAYVLLSTFLIHRLCILHTSYLQIKLSCILHIGSTVHWVHDLLKDKTMHGSTDWSDMNCLMNWLVWNVHDNDESQTINMWNTHNCKVHYYDLGMTKIELYL